MIVDAHAHLWQRHLTPQPWIDPITMAAIDRDVWLDDLLAMQRQSGIARTVLVQTAHSTAETLAFLAVADAHPRTVPGVVGWLDLHGDVETALRRLRDARGGDALVGIRHLVHQDPDEHWLSRARTGAGLDALAAADLPFDLVLRPEQLADAAALVARHPETRFVLDHLGKPPIAAAGMGARDGLERWRDDLAAVAAAPNTVAKLSGVVTEAHWDRWDGDELRGAIDHAFTVFGPDRLLFGSDWPVVLLAAAPREWVDVVDGVLADLAPDLRARVWGGNAVRVYGLAHVENDR
ncbi:amidohydrolase family protein [Microbacterium sp. JZ31]|uniref:amidohydrolase family protein n=1 Tax=Microbacterium sp. JZ31 TaxID=1906274 RepID=UPI001933F8BA|nr:amidohydrolase family protein [Microbacterium sp. JZ31]